MQKRDLERTRPSDLPVRVVQFGEGNFLRAFVEYAFQKLNTATDFGAGIAVVQPIATGMIDRLAQQDGLYTLFMQGYEKGHEVRERELITNIVKTINPYESYSDFISLARQGSLEFVISNTTEAGISFDENDTPEMTPPSSFPAKLTRFLFERYSYFDGAGDAGLTILPCELINHNSDQLKDFVIRYIRQWNLGNDFEQWVTDACDFHNTLVDRIVPGYPGDAIEKYESELDYTDRLIVTAESYFLWVIEGDDKLKEKLPFHRAGLNVKIVNDMQPYRTRKVRILNGAHTAMVPMSLLCGNSTVRQTIEDPFAGKFIEDMLKFEVIPVLPLPEDELTDYAAEIMDRFRNPFIEHQLSSIALNSISKFRVRVLPSMKEYIELKNELPVRLVYAFACLIRFYQGSWEDEPLPLADDAQILQYFGTAWENTDREAMVHGILGATELWEEDLTRIPMLAESIALALACIADNGVVSGFGEFSDNVELKIQN